MSMLKRTKGYWVSLASLRHTRLDLAKLQKKVSSLAAPAAVRSASSAAEQKHAVIDGLQQISILREIGARQALDSFRPNEAFANARPDQKILTNGLAVDFDGGVNENLKTALRSGHISQRHTEDGDISLISVMRPELVQFWKCVSRAYEFHIPLYYAETTFFAGFASYFDKSVPPAFKKSLGFIIDDMGYYFDSRMPSRLETNLNDETWSISKSEQEGAQSLIKAVIENQITKYNRYAGRVVGNYLPEGIVLVVDQKRNDASIRLGAASSGTFNSMLEAAVAENPGKRIFVKPHPDNNFEKGGDRYKSGNGWMFVDEGVSVSQAMEQADTVYTVSSQVGFEALLRGKRVVTFGLPFYAGWGLTDDRQVMPRRKTRRSIEELFHQACVEMSVYVDPTTGEPTNLANTIDRVLWMRSAVA